MKIIFIKHYQHYVKNSCVSFGDSMADSLIKLGVAELFVEDSQKMIYENKMNMQIEKETK